MKVVAIKGWKEVMNVVTISGWKECNYRME